MSEPVLTWRRWMLGTAVACATSPLVTLLTRFIWPGSLWHFAASGFVNAIVVCPSVAFILWRAHGRRSAASRGLSDLEPPKCGEASGVGNGPGREAAQ